MQAPVLSKIFEILLCVQHWPDLTDPIFSSVVLVVPVLELIAPGTYAIHQ